MSKKIEDISNTQNSKIKPVFEKRFKEMLKNDSDYQEFINTILKPQKKSFRINSIKVNDKNKLIEELLKRQYKLLSVPWCNNAYFVEYDENNRTDIGNLFEHFLGKIYVQEATSLTPPLLLEIPDKIDDTFKVLDMAASPGSKTTQIGDLMKNKGIIVANEVDYSRLGALKINLERSGLTNIIITNNDARFIQGEQIYDRILLDAPCSGSGVIRKSPKTLKTYNPNRLKQMQNLQLKLLKKAFELLKNNCIMTYSTCSLDPEENEICIAKFLETHPNAKLLSATLPNLKTKTKITEFEGFKIPKDITENTLRIWPHENDTNGFFVAKIIKIQL